MANSDQLGTAQELIDEILSTPVKDLIHKTAWGSLNFNDAESELQQMHSSAAHLRDLPIEQIPDGPMSAIVEALRSARDACKNIHGFSLDQSTNPRDERARYSQTAKSAAGNLVIATANWIPFLAYQKGDIQRNLEQLRGAVQTAEGELNDARSAINLKKGEIDGIVTAAREASASVGVGHFASDFAKEFGDLKKEAAFWLKWTAGLGVSTVSAAIVSGVFIHVPTDASSAYVVHLMTSKVVVLLALLFATVWCGRIYKATMHQAVTNKHRANSLKTFQAFVKAASDDPTRDAVLLESTRSIFALAASGYLDSTEPALDTGTKVLEVFKGRTGSS